MSRQERQRVKVVSAVAATVAGALVCARSAAASLAAHLDVAGPDVTAVEVRRGAGAWEPADWDDLEATRREPGRYDVRFHVDAGPDGRAVRLPVCAGRGLLALDGRGVGARPGPVVVPMGPGHHEIVIGVEVSAYESRIACGERPRVGAPVDSAEGLGSIVFASPH